MQVARSAALKSSSARLAAARVSVKAKDREAADEADFGSESFDKESKQEDKELPKGDEPTEGRAPGQGANIPFKTTS